METRKGPAGMAIRLTFPTKRNPVYFESPANYTSFGTKREEELAPLQTNLFHKVHEQFWEQLIHERKIDLAARKKLYDMEGHTLQTLTQRFTKFTASDIQDLRFQFQCFDLNSDGLIDKTELMHALDDMGDKSDIKKREQCFQEVDEDGSGAIDFEEFLGLIYRLRYEAQDENASNAMTVMRKFGDDTMNNLKKFSVIQQMENGLF